MSNYNIQTVEFHGQNIPTIFHNEKHYVGMKAICENIGLDWHAQRQRIKRHEVLNSVAVMITSTGKDSKIYKMLCLPLEMLNGWLFGVEANRVKAEIRDTLIQYQRECFGVLFKHFHNPTQQAEPQAKLESPYIEGKQLQHIKAGVKRIVHKTGKSYQTVYGGLNHFFGAPNINEIEKGYYGRVCVYLDIPTDFEVPADTMTQQLLELKNEDHTNGLALLKRGAKVLAVQDAKLEKVAEHLNEAIHYFEEARQCRGAIYDGFHESIVRLNVTKEENQQSNKKAEDIFNHWRARKQM